MVEFRSESSEYTLRDSKSTSEFPTFKVVPQMTALRSRHFMTRRLIKTPTNHIFSESLIIEDYQNVFLKKKR